MVPDIIQQAASDSEAEADSNETGGSAGDRHLIVNQLLTFLTEKEQSSEATNTASTTSTLRLTDP